MIVRLLALVAGTTFVAACAGTNDLDPGAAAAYVEVRGNPAPTDTALLRRATAFLARCPVPTAALDSSTTVVLEGAPRLAIPLPRGFRVVGGRLPTPTMQRIEGPDGERILVERDPMRIVAFGVAYAQATDIAIFSCWQPSQGSRVPAQVQSFFPKQANVVTPSSVAAAVANVPTVVVSGTPVSVAVHARTTERRTALATLLTRMRVVP
jgi:hypothetical protein